MCTSIFGGTKYNKAQVQDVLRKAGWPEKLIPIVSAISMAESSGYTGAVNPCGEYSVGLLQVNINPKLKRPWTQAQLVDPIFNAKVALKLYAERTAQGLDGLTHWGAYTDGRYKAYLGADASPPGSFVGGGSGSGGVSALKAAYTLNDSQSKILGQQVSPQLKGAVILMIALIVLGAVLVNANIL